MPLVDDWISKSPTNPDVVAPIKARVCDGFHAALKHRQRPMDREPRLMHRGAERC